MKNIYEILKSAPIGTKLYCPICGTVTLERVRDTDDGFCIVTSNNKGSSVYFTKFGQYQKDNDASECLLFPSSDNRTWDNVSFEPVRQDCEIGTLMVTFLYPPKSTIDVRMMIYAGNNKCFMDKDRKNPIVCPHAVPFDKFNFDTLEYNKEDDYGVKVHTKKDSDPSVNIKKILSEFFN